MTGSQEQSGSTSVDHDEALLQAWRDGDESALSELLVSFQPRVWSICWRMVRHAEDATDLAQDVLVKVMNGLSGFDGRSKLSTWVIRITMNCCLSHLRKQKLRRHASLDAPGIDGGDSRADRLQDGEPGPIQDVQRRDQHRRVQMALLELDEEQRLLLLLRDVQGAEYAQLAEVYEVPIGTIKSRIFRARSALRALLEPTLSGPPAPDSGGGRPAAHDTT